MTYPQCGNQISHGCYRPGGTYWWNQWRADVNAWMKDKNVKEYKKVKQRHRQGAHLWGRSAFNTYIHHLAGQRVLVQMLVKLPIIAQCSDPNPNRREVPALDKWLEDLRHHKQSDEYKKAVKMSERAADRDQHYRLSRKIWEAHRKLSQGKRLAAERGSWDEDLAGKKWDELKETERELLDKYDCGKLQEELRDLMSKKTPPEKRYKGVATAVAEKNTQQRWRAPHDWPGWSLKRKSEQHEETAGWTPDAKKIRKGSATPPAPTV